MFTVADSALDELNTIGTNMDADEAPPSPTPSNKSSGLPFTVQDLSSDYTPQSTKVRIVNCF